MSIDYEAIEKAGGIGKGENHWLAGRKRRKAIVDREEREKTKVRKRDGRCRWPHCENCLKLKPPLEVAHRVAKGQGGDHGARSDANQMLVLDKVTHQIGPFSLEQHGRRIEVIDPAQGTDGPLEFWQTNPETGEQYMVAREIAPFIYERD